MSSALKTSIEAVVKAVASTQKIQLPELKDHLAIVDDLGFTSLAVAALIANLEEELAIDPFQDEEVMISDIRTLADLYKVYSRT